MPICRRGRFLVPVLFAVSCVPKSNQSEPRGAASVPPSVASPSAGDATLPLPEGGVLPGGAVTTENGPRTWTWTPAPQDTTPAPETDAPTPVPAQAAAAEIDIVSTLSREAVFVFHGRVQQVRFTQTLNVDRATNREASLPVTAVTYGISKVLRGQYPDATITLYFAGGLDPRTNTLVEGMGVTQFFNEGDEDILFVKDASKLAPLVENGRLPILDGNVYTQSSHAIEALPDGTLVQGAFSPQRKILEHRIGSFGVGLQHSADLSASAQRVASPVPLEVVERKLGTLVRASTAVEVRVLTDETLPVVEWGVKQ